MESGSPFVYYPCLLLCGNQTIAKKLWPATLVFWPTVNDAPACRVPRAGPRSTLHEAAARDKAGIRRGGRLRLRVFPVGTIPIRRLHAAIGCSMLPRTLILIAPKAPQMQTTSKDEECRGRPGGGGRGAPIG